MLSPRVDWKGLPPHDDYDLRRCISGFVSHFTIFGVIFLALRIPSSLFCFLFVSFLASSLNWGVVVGVFAQSWLVSPGISSAFSFALVLGFSLFQFEKVLILALEGIRLPSLLTPHTSKSNPTNYHESPYLTCLPDLLFFLLFPAFNSIIWIIITICISF